jgi:hypothetical protein
MPLFSYDETLADRVAQVRLLLGDTDKDDPLLSDQEITFLLSSEPNIYRAAATGAESIAMGSARMNSFKVGQLSVTFTGAVKDYMTLARSLRRRAVANVSMYAGGISVSERDSARLDTGIIQPPFVTDMESEPGTQVIERDIYPVR